MGSAQKPDTWFSSDAAERDEKYIEQLSATNGDGMPSEDALDAITAESDAHKLKEFETWLRFFDPSIKYAFLKKMLEAMPHDSGTFQTRQQTQAETGAKLLYLDGIPEAPPPVGPQAIVEMRPEDQFDNVRGARIHQIDEQLTEPEGEQ
jgi:hypothetical protein